MRVSLIVAHDEGGVIAVDGRIPWDLPKERSYFRRVTGDHAVIMGRKTWETLGGALAGRYNMVLTGRGTGQTVRDVLAGGGRWIGCGIVAALRHVEAIHYGEAFIIGGAEVYRSALEVGVVERIYATEVHARYDGVDVRRFEMPAGWRCVEEGARRAATATRPAWTPRVWRRA